MLCPAHDDDRRRHVVVVIAASNAQPRNVAKWTVLRGCTPRYDQTASDPVITLNQNSDDSGIPTRFNQNSSHSKN